jgi:hypothetical protein
MSRAALWCAALWLHAALAAVDGTVTNGTSGKPQPNLDVTYMVFGDAGMQPAGSAKTDSEGKFKIDTAAPAGGPSMLQATFEGVTYNQMLRPGTPTSGVTLQVYYSSPKVPEAKVSQHMILFEPSDKLTVNETYIYQNDSKTTFRDSSGATFRFYLPPEAGGNVRVRVTGAQGMPTDRAARETKEKNVYGVDYPIRPGESRFDLTYELPAASPLKYQGRLLHDGTARLVAPQGVKFSGAQLEFLGQEPSTQATVYGVKGREFSIAIEGTGSLSSPSVQQPDENENAVKESKPRIYQRLYWVLGLTLLILTLGLVLLYRSGERRA